MLFHTTAAGHKQRLPGRHKAAIRQTRSCTQHTHICCPASLLHAVCSHPLSSFHTNIPPAPQNNTPSSPRHTLFYQGSSCQPHSEPSNPAATAIFSTLPPTAAYCCTCRSLCGGQQPNRIAVTRPGLVEAVPDLRLSLLAPQAQVLSAATGPDGGAAALKRKLAGAMH